MAIYNWKENCEKILQTQKYTSNKNSFFEQIVFIKYLKDKNINKEEIFTLWKKTESPQIKILQEYNDTEISILFKTLWQKANNCKIFDKQFSFIQIYQKEIDYINSLLCEEWFRKYLLGLLSFYKYFNKNYMTLTKEILKDILNSIGKKELSDRQIKIANKYRKQYSLYISKGEIINNKQERVMKINFKQEQGIIIKEYTNPLDFINLFYLLKKGTQLCKDCHNIFEINANTKRELCIDCYKKQRQNYINNYKKDKRKKEKIEMETGVTKNLYNEREEQN